MNCTVEKLSSNKVKLSFEVEAEKFEEGMKKAYKKMVGRFNIPGFRRGKAPRKIIENFYGEEIFYDEAFQAVFPEIYAQAVAEHDVKVVDRPDVNITEIGTGKPMKVECEVYVRPDVTLGDYKAVKVEKEAVKVSDDDVTAEITRIRERNARFVEVTDRPAKLDDQVNIDYAGFLGEEQFEGGTAEKYDLTLGSGAFIPGFEDQLVGATVGSNVDVNVTFPEEYHSKELAGKAVVFHVKVNAITEKEVPELDEDFVKEVSESANTVDEYKAEVFGDLMMKAEERAEADFENEVLEKVVEGAEMDIPDAMIEEQVDAMLRDMEMRLMVQGMRLADYFKYTGQKEAEVREMYKPQAEQRVRTQLVLDAIRAAEGIEPTEEDVDAELAKYADQSKKSMEEFKKDLTEEDLNYFKEATSVQKTIDFLKETCKA
ncbi:MAG: trigger factor [Clostridia bacterium]|nr:trigger factor [Clostridia bacterium]